MKRWLSPIVLFFSFAAFASDTIDAKLPTDVIKLRVGEKKFRVQRATLCKLPSKFSAMFDAKSALNPGNQDEKGRYFLDHDPKTFEHFLDFLRTDHVMFKSETKAHQTLMRSDEFACPEFNAAIMRWISRRSYRSEKSVAIVASKEKNANRKHWFIVTKSDHLYLGSKKYGFQSKRNVYRFIKEYRERNFHKELGYSWSGFNYTVVNYVNGQVIGDHVRKSNKHEVLSSIDNFLRLDIIRYAERVNDNLYICTFNKLGTFSIYDAYTGEKKVARLEFATLDECAAEIIHQANNGHL